MLLAQRTKSGRYYIGESETILNCQAFRKLRGKVQLILTSSPFPLSDPKRPYASTSNYGHKVIFKARNGQMYVVSIPARELKKQPTIDDLPNLQVILSNCFMVIHLSLFIFVLVTVQHQKLFRF